MDALLLGTSWQSDVRTFACSQAGKALAAYITISGGASSAVAQSAVLYHAKCVPAVASVCIPV